MSKKLVFAAAFSLLVLAVVVAPSAASASFNVNLTIGSRGADVIALQTWLIAQGYSIPAGATGYFGLQTRAAVAAYQAAKGITPAVGFFGPITRASVNGAGGVAVGPLCPNGMTIASNCTLAPSAVAQSLCPNGMTLASNCTLSPSAQAPGTLNGDGSLTVTYNPYAPASQTLKKGDSKDIIAVKLQATGGTVAVQRLDVYFSERPWLDFSQIVLKDSTGRVIATKAISSASDVTEVTVGSSYFVRFDNLNGSLTVTPGSDVIAVVNASVLAASDKITGQTVYVGIPAGAIRTINGLGYTDSLGITSGTGSGVTSSTGVALTLSSTGSTGSITTSVSTSAQTKRTVAVSPTAVTNDVELGRFSLKVQNQNATINSLSFNINSTSSIATTSLYQNVRLYDGNGKLLAGANSLAAGSPTFNQLTLPLTQDVWTDIKLVADVVAGNGGQAASSTLVGSSIVGTDSNYNTLTVSSASNQTSADNVYTYSGLNIVASAPSVSNCISGFGQNYGQTSCDLSFSFTASATANNVGDIFISVTPGIALATSSSPMTSSTTLSQINLTSISGDVSGVSYRVPTTGRTFTYAGTFSKAGGAPALETFRINKIWYGVGTASSLVNGPTSTAVSNASTNIDYGLENLFISKTL